MRFMLAGKVRLSYGLYMKQPLSPEFKSLTTEHFTKAEEVVNKLLTERDASRMGLGRRTLNEVDGDLVTVRRILARRYRHAMTNMLLSEDFCPSAFRLLERRARRSEHLADTVAERLNAAGH